MQSRSRMRFAGTLGLLDLFPGRLLSAAYSYKRDLRNEADEALLPQMETVKITLGFQWQARDRWQL